MSRTSTKRKTWKERIITIEAFTVISYLVLNSSLMFIYALAGGIASIERRFHFDSTTMGRVILANDLGPLGGLLFFSYFANRFNLSHVLGIMGIVYAIGIALFTLPQYIFKYEDDNTESVVINNTILCVNATEKNHLTSQDATDSGTHHIKSAVFGIMFAALFIAGVTIYPLATLPQSYIEWNTRKSRTAIYIAIANLGWATSPLFGFLLSAWCMSMYVDLSETQLTPDDPAWIGAWWLSIVIVSGLTLIPSVFYFVFPKSIDGKTTQLEVKTPDPEETASQTPDAQKLDPDIADKADNKEKQDAHSFKGIVANIIHDCVTLMQVCCHRTCSDCGVDKLTFLPEELQSEGKIVKWSMFDYKVVYQDKEVVEHLKTLLQDFTSHQFKSLWQRDVYLLMKQDLPLKQAIAIHDYSENYSCEFQDQIQSLYFGQQQASIHVTLLFNHAADSTEDIPNILCDHMFVISSDLTHDFNSVHDVRGNVAKYFNDICVQIDVLHEFTDGCSAQYKSRHCLNDLSFSEEDFGFKSVRHFYETSHAKGPQDGAGANLKNFASMSAIKRKIVIRNAKELFNYVSTTFTESRHGKCMNKRVFFYTESVKKCGREVKTVTNVHLRKLHSVQKTGEPNRVQVRNLSCGCPYCLDLDYMHCINKNYVPNWNTLHLTPENMTFRTSRASTPTAAPDADSEDAEDRVIAVSDLITSDSIVALESDELLNPYYLVTVQSGPDVLKDTETDSYGVGHYKGETVFRGHYFKFLKDDRTGKRFTLSLKKFLFYYPGTVRYICSDIQKVGSGKNVYNKLTEVEEIDLIGFLLSIKRLMLNPVYVLSVCGYVLWAEFIWGFQTFCPKVVQEVYAMATWESSLVAAVVIGIGATIGQVSAGVLSSYLKISLRKNVILVVALTGMTSLLMVGAVFIGCDSPDVVGTSEHGSGFIIDQQCASQCDCSGVPYSPICDAGRTYFSPCHAGCLDTNTTATNQNVYTECSCTETGTAIRGVCEVPCNMLIPYGVIVFLVFMLTFFTLPLIIVFILRCVEPEDMSLGFGLNMLFVGMLGFLPAPILSGSVVDTACIVWEDQGGGVQGSCWIYDLVALRQRFNGLGAVQRFVQFLCFAIAYFLARNKFDAWEERNTDEDQTQNQTNHARRNSDAIQDVENERETFLN